MEHSLSFEPYLLTPLDHIIKNFHVSSFLSFPLDNPNTAVAALKDGVERLTYALPFLAGARVPSSKLPGKRNLKEIQPSPESLKWIPMLQIKYHSDTTLEATCSPGPSGSLRLNDSWTPLPVIIPADQPSPVGRFRADIFPDGILLCMTLNHGVLDGTGVGNVLKMLATCCSANSATNLPISFPTTYAKEASSRQIILDNAIPSSVSNTEAFSRIFQSNDIIPGLDKEVTSRRFSFPASKIRDLKDACNTARPTDQDPTLSRNDVLTALLAICMNRARRNGQTKSPTSSLAVPVNLRRKFQPHLPESYLGNSIIPLVVDIDPPTNLPTPRCATTPTHADLKDLTTLSLKIRKDLKLLNQDFVGGLVSYLREQSDWEAASMKFTDITVSSLRHLDIDGLDFGPEMGRASRFDVQSGMYPGICDIMPICGSNRVGDVNDVERLNHDEMPWDVTITLEDSVWSTFMEDGLLLWALDRI